MQRPHPPLLIAAASRRLLSFAAREADIIGIAPSITAKQLGDQPRGSRWRRPFDEQIEWIRTAAGDRGEHIELNMVAFPLAVTDDAAGAAAAIGPAVGLSPEEVLRSPHIWIGTPTRSRLRSSASRALGHLLLGGAGARDRPGRARHRAARRPIESPEYD